MSIHAIPFSLDWHEWPVELDNNNNNNKTRINMNVSQIDFNKTVIEIQGGYN